MPNFDLSPMVERLRQAYWDKRAGADIGFLGIKAANVDNPEVTIDEETVDQYVPGIVIRADDVSFTGSIARTYEGSASFYVIFSRFVDSDEESEKTMLQALGALANAFLPDPEDADTSDYAFPNWRVQDSLDHGYSPLDLTNVEFAVDPIIEGYKDRRVEHGAVIFTLLLHTT